MSLRYFHVVFIVASLALSLVLGGWGIYAFRATQNASNLAIGIFGGTSALGLLGYLFWFNRKMSRISNLALLWGSLMILIAYQQPSLACSVCYGDPASPLSKGAKFGAMALIGFISGVLFAIALIGRTWAKRARALNQEAF